MRIIDEKGRLFGKINVIDFLVILFLLSLSPMFYFGYKIFNKKQSSQAVGESAAKEIIETEAAFILTRIDPKTADMVSTADEEIDANGEVIGTIISLDKARPLVYEIDVGNGQELTQESPSMKEIPAILRLKAEMRDNTIYYKDKLIQINSAIDFKTGKYAVQALLVPPGNSRESAKAKNEIRDILLPALEQKITDLQSAMNSLKSRIEAVEIFSKQNGKSKK